MYHTYSISQLFQNFIVDNLIANLKTAMAIFYLSA